MVHMLFSICLPGYGLYLDAGVHTPKTSMSLRKSGSSNGVVYSEAGYMQIHVVYLEGGYMVVSTVVSGILFACFPTVECISKGYSFLL